MAAGKVEVVSGVDGDISAEVNLINLYVTFLDIDILKVVYIYILSSRHCPGINLR